MIPKVLIIFMAGSALVYGLVLFYYQIKTLNMRQELKGNYDPLAFGCVLNPMVAWGMKNEFPKNKEYTRYYKIYSKIKWISIPIGIIYIIIMFVFGFLV